MQTNAHRVELLRFALLVTMTVALLSVVVRLSSHPASHAGAAHGAGSPRTTPTAALPTTSVPASVPSTGGSSTPAPTGPAHGPTGSTGRHGHGTGGGTGGSSGGTSGGSSSRGGGQVLPVTGWDAAMKLSALGLVLLSAGSLLVRGSRRSPAARR